MAESGVKLPSRRIWIVISKACLDRYPRQPITGIGHFSRFEKYRASFCPNAPKIKLAIEDYELMGVRVDKLEDVNPGRR